MSSRRVRSAARLHGGDAQSPALRHSASTPGLGHARPTTAPEMLASMNINIPKLALGGSAAVREAAAERVLQVGRAAREEVKHVPVHRRAKAVGCARDGAPSVTKLCYIKQPYFVYMRSSIVVPLERLDILLDLARLLAGDS